MSSRHVGFLLNAKAFITEARPLLSKLEHGDASELFEYAAKAYEQALARGWPLKEAGSPLVDIRESNVIGERWVAPVTERLKEPSTIHPYDLGYWLLLILSQHLQESVGIGKNYLILRNVLDMMGVTHEVLTSLFEGMPTVTLLRPDEPPVEEVSAETPYWHCMRPYYAHKSGWLAKDSIAQIYGEWLSLRTKIEGFDYRQFGESFYGWTLTVPDGQVEFLGRLQEAYARATGMLELATRRQSDLFVALADA
jgi:hypothetical protein